MKHLMPDADEFAYGVATQGPEAFETEIRRLAYAVRDQEVSRDELEIMLARSVPEVLRQRAFGAAGRNVPKVVAPDLPGEHDQRAQGAVR